MKSGSWKDICYILFIITFWQYPRNILNNQVSFNGWMDQENVVWKYFIPFHRCLFIWLMVYFAEQKVSVWCSPTHLFLHSLFLFLVSNPKNSSPRSMSGGLLPVFSYRIFMVSDFTYKSFNLFFWVDFCVVCYSGPASFFCMWLLFFPAPYIEGTVPFLLCIIGSFVEN